MLSDLSQVDPSDLSMLFAGPGRLRIGFAEIDPPAGEDPTDQQVNHAVGICWENPYSLFSKPVGTSLICIQGQWSNVVDGHLKGGLAALATSGGTNATYNPLHAFTPAAPKPWGVTALFAEYTGSHSPLDIEWPEVRSGRPLWFSTAVAAKPAAIGVAADAGVPQIPIAAAEVGRATQIVDAAQQRPAQTVAHVASETSSGPRSFSTFWEFALALNRNDASALAVAADGTTCDMPIEASQIRKLLGTVWFRSVFRSLSSAWRNRLLDVLLDDTRIHNHAVRGGRRLMRLDQMSYDELQRVAGNPGVKDAVRADVQLLVAIATLWGSDALKRVTFVPAPEVTRPARFDLLTPFRHL